jgi:hypothetical protein
MRLELLGRWMASLVLAGILIWTSGAEAGPITFNTALPVHANELILREQVIWLRATDDPTPDRPQETIRMAPFVGLKMPTGATGIADDLGQLPPALQLGSGSWDPFGGLIFTWQKLRWEFDASGSYLVRTRANDFNAGMRREVTHRFNIVWSPGARSARVSQAGSSSCWKPTSSGKATMK